MIPFVCDILDITAQELFDTTQKARQRCFKYFIESADSNELEYFYNFINTQIKNNANIKYERVISTPSVMNEKIQNFLHLLKYAPNNFIDRVIDKLKEYKKLDENI